MVANTFNINNNIVFIKIKNPKNTLFSSRGRVMVDLSVKYQLAWQIEEMLLAQLIEQSENNGKQMVFEIECCRLWNEMFSKKDNQNAAINYHCVASLKAKKRSKCRTSQMIFIFSVSFIVIKWIKLFTIYNVKKDIYYLATELSLADRFV